MLDLTLSQLGPELAALPEVQTLCRDLVGCIKSSKADSTWQAYLPQMRQFIEFARRLKQHPLKVNPTLAAMYLTRVYKNAVRDKVGPQRVDCASAAISALFQAFGQQSPCDGSQCQAVRETAHRTLRGKSRGRESVTAADIRALVDKHIVEGVKLRTRMIVTCIVLSYAGMLRFSDLCRVLVHHDLLRFYPDRVEFFLFKSKTDQRCEGALVPVGRVGGKYCPAQLVETLLQVGGYRRQPRQLASTDADGTVCLSDLEDVGPLLRNCARGGNSLRADAVNLPDVIQPMSYSTYSKALKALFAEAGVTKKISPHSLRSGGATEAVNAGAERAVVQKLGRWRTDSVFERCYVRDSEGAKQRVTMCMGLAPLPASEWLRLGLRGGALRLAVKMVCPTFSVTVITNENPRMLGFFRAEHSEALKKTGSWVEVVILVICRTLPFGLFSVEQVPPSLSAYCS
ncbi:hypothetical protein PLESTB_000282000 [Pleodorina starrii]|uniref:Tyr recombinase domain-containing protein n=1 Tax=Pleodorina starrii TaxID=330485 RepID=A0A9W6EZ45_9CHLO|nr:hypothetical protein PLESTB_000282000 [Pleodorina starrii]